MADAPAADVAAAADVTAIATAARAAALQLGAATLAQRNAVLAALAEGLRASLPAVLAANAADGAAAAAAGLEPATLKRLVLDEAKLAALLDGLRDLAALPDPLGRASLARTLAPGLELRRASCPLGVLAIIFEARPEAVIQIASLAIKSGNAVILKGGKEAARSNGALVALVRGALAAVGAAATPRDAVQLVGSREDVAALLRLDELIDLVIPRGSLRLVREVKAATRIPVLGHADGVCHVYLDACAEPALAAPLVVDSKAHYPAACNAAETLLVHRGGALARALPLVAQRLLEAGVTLHADAECKPVALAALAAAQAAAAAAAGAPPLGAVVDAVPADWDTEWLSLHMGVAAVGSTEEAIAWVNAHGSGHTDAIVSSDAGAPGGSVARFLAGVDSAGVYHNASTRFADGFRYGFGAEVGISTNKLHARGPVGLEGLCTYKYTLAGQGHTVAQFGGGGGGGGEGGMLQLYGTSLPQLQWVHKDHEV